MSVTTKREVHAFTDRDRKTVILYSISTVVGFVWFMGSVGLSHGMTFCSLIVFAIGLGGLSNFFFGRFKAKRAAYNTERSRVEWRTKLNTLSNIGQLVYHRYYNLPADHRPSIEIFDLLRDVDIKRGGKGVVDGHFRGIRPNNDSPNNVRCVDAYNKGHNLKYGYADCGTMPEYHSMLNELNSVFATLKHRDQILAKAQRDTAVANAQHGVDEFNAVVARLREEREVLTSANKEIKELM